MTFSELRARVCRERAVVLTTSARLEDLPLEDVERLLIRKALDRYGGNVSQAAKALGLSRSALYRRIAAYGI